MCGPRSLRGVLSLWCALLTLVLSVGAPIPPAGAAATVHRHAESSTARTATVQIGSKVYTVEVAQTAEEKMKGLMGRRSLPENRGMLFLFEPPQAQGFWMKNTLIPLDIIFIAEDGRIESFHTMQPCVADPCPIYPSRGRIRYALEVNAGEVRKHKFSVGDAVTVRLHGRKDR